MTLLEMLTQIRTILRSACFTDIVEQTGVSESTVSQWRNEPPALPSLSVFCKLARYCGLNPSIKQLEQLF